MAIRREDQNRPEPHIFKEEEAILGVLEDAGLPQRVNDEIIALVRAALETKARIDGGERRYSVSAGEICRYEDCYAVVDLYGDREVARFMTMCPVTKAQAEQLAAMLNGGA